MRGSALACLLSFGVLHDLTYGTWVKAPCPVGTLAYPGPGGGSPDWPYFPFSLEKCTLHAGNEWGRLGFAG